MVQQMLSQDSSRYGHFKVLSPLDIIIIALFINLCPQSKNYFQSLKFLPIVKRYFIIELTKLQYKFLQWTSPIVNPILGPHWEVPE
jgi:hypothetical protein